MLAALCLLLAVKIPEPAKAAQKQSGGIQLERENEKDSAQQKNEEEKDSMQQKNGNEKNSAQQEKQGEELLLEQLDFSSIQDEVDQLLDGQEFSFADTVSSFLAEEDTPFRSFRVGKIVLSCLQKAFLAQKDLLKELFLLVLSGAVLGSFSSLVEEKQVKDTGFYLVCLLEMALILRNFQSSGENLKAVVASFVSFMRVLAPSYYLAAAAAGGVSTAVMFYQMLLLVILAVEKLFLTLVLPLIYIYLLIALVNDLSGEEILSHMTELLETCVNGLLKSSLGVLVGMQLIRSLIAPALDSLRQTAIGRTAGMIPGIGNAVNAVTELVVGSAILIRNCFGVTAMLVLLSAGMVPAIQLLVSGISFRLLAAAAQPVSDKRIVGCLAAAGKGYAMLLRLFLTVEILFLLTIAILAGTFS